MPILSESLKRSRRPNNTSAYERGERVLDSSCSAFTNYFVEMDYADIEPQNLTTAAGPLL